MTSRTNGHAPPEATRKAARRSAAAPSPAAPDPGAGLTRALELLGDVVKAILPSGATSQERAAAEYWGASVANQYAESWRGRAKRQAVAVGVLPAAVYPIGTAETVYAGPVVTIGLKVVAQASRVDVPMLIADLERAGVSPRVLKRLTAKHTHEFPGAHVFTATLVA